MLFRNFLPNGLVTLGKDKVGKGGWGLERLTMQGKEGRRMLIKKGRELKKGIYTLK